MMFTQKDCSAGGRSKFTSMCRSFSPENFRILPNCPQPVQLSPESRPAYRYTIWRLAWFVGRVEWTLRHQKSTKRPSCCPCLHQIRPAKGAGLQCTAFGLIPVFLENLQLPS